MVVMNANTLSDRNTSPATAHETPRTKVVTFVNALKDKYVYQEEFDNQIVLPKDNSISTDITLVGFGKVSSVQRQLRQLISIDLSGMNIEVAGNLDLLKGYLDRVRILNLADNQLTWQEIIHITSCLPNLRELILTDNRLSQCNINVPSRTLRKLNSLTLGRINLDWANTITVLSKIFASVEQLDLWDSKLDLNRMKIHTDKFNPFISHISTIKLSYNCFEDLRWSRNVGPLSSLVELDVSHCQLKKIELDDSATNQLCNLRTLNISANNINDWISISHLNKLDDLINLICHDNPLMILEKLAKPFTIARLSKLRVLNREEVPNNVRRDSEILYIRKVFPEYKQYKEGKFAEFPLMHPRYEELATTYGLSEDLSRTQVNDKYITVDLCCLDQKVTRKLSCDMRISNLNMLCKRLFKLKASSNIEILCCESDPSAGGITYPLDRDDQTLHFFSVQNNQRLLIKKIDE